MFGVSLGSLVSLAVLIIIVLVCREIVCWYWKINYATDLLEKILVELKKNTEDPKKPSTTDSWIKRPPSDGTTIDG